MPILMVGLECGRRDYELPAVVVMATMVEEVEEIVSLGKISEAGADLLSYRVLLAMPRRALVTLRQTPRIQTMRLV